MSSVACTDTDTYSSLPACCLVLSLTSINRSLACCFSLLTVRITAVRFAPTDFLSLCLPAAWCFPSQVPIGHWPAASAVHEFCGRRLHKEPADGGAGGCVWQNVSGPATAMVRCLVVGVYDIIGMCVMIKGCVYVCVKRARAKGCRAAFQWFGGACKLLGT